MPARMTKPTPLEAFEANMNDARYLVSLSEGLTNDRARKMRAELRQRIGVALRIPASARADLDCLESVDVFLTFLPGSRLHRSDFVDHRPLLRQALVAGCAATETYVADKVMTRIGPLLASESVATDRLKQMPMTVGDWLHIEEDYTRRRRGLRERVVQPSVRIQASTAPSKVGQLLSLIGVRNWTKQLDQHRQVPSGDTEKLLARVTDRRNRIAHEGDRRGNGRAPLTLDEVKRDLAGLEAVVAAIEAIVR